MGEIDTVAPTWQEEMYLIKKTSPLGLSYINTEEESVLPVKRTGEGGLQEAK